MQTTRMRCTTTWLFIITTLAISSEGMATSLCKCSSGAHGCFTKAELTNLFTIDNATMAYYTLKRLSEAANMLSRFNELDFAYMCLFYPLKYHTDRKHWHEMRKWCEDVVQYYDFYDIIQPIQSLLCDIRPKPNPEPCPCMQRRQHNDDSIECIGLI